MARTFDMATPVAIKPDREWDAEMKLKLNDNKMGMRSDKSTDMTIIYNRPESLLHEVVDLVNREWTFWPYELQLNFINRLSDKLRETSHLGSESDAVEALLNG